MTDGVSAADHETALRDFIPRCPAIHLAPLQRSLCSACRREQEMHAALDALVGLLRQTEQERDEQTVLALTRAESRRMYRERAEQAEREVERLKRGNRYPMDEDVAGEDELVDVAWRILCNVSEGDWTKQPEDWQRAVERFREQYHAYLTERGNQERENQVRETPQSGVEAEAGEWQRAIRGLAKDEIESADRQMTIGRSVEFWRGRMGAYTDLIVWLGGDAGWAMSQPPTSTTNAERSPVPDWSSEATKAQSARAIEAEARCVRLEEALREAESVLTFHEAINAERERPSQQVADLVYSVRAALAAVGVPPDGET